MFRITNLVAASLVLVLAAGTAQAEVTIDYVTVGDPGNAADTEVMNDGSSGYGSVAEVYRMGKYEVTNAQYVEFLNAVAAEDTHGLYNPGMWAYIQGCKIERHGSSPNYTYSVAADRANRPVNLVSFWDATRFANWLHNGQPTGAQDNTTTEDGAYTLTKKGMNDNSVARNPGALVWVPSEDEWYKAAYYKGGGINAGYWDYPTQSDTPPTWELPPGTDMVNGSANYFDRGYLDATYYTMEVGAYTAKPSDGAYGTFGQGGNLTEWNEATWFGLGRGHRGGSYAGPASFLHPYYRFFGDSPASEFDIVGFRVASVPEPSTIAMLALGGLALLTYLSYRGSKLY